MKKFSEEGTRTARAQQAYQILISKAMNKQTITYKELGNLMFHKHSSGVVSKFIGPITYYCDQNDLPPLTILVVNSKSGVSGKGLAEVIDVEKNSALRETVFNYDWYAVFMPTEDELQEAIDNGKK